MDVVASDDTEAVLNDLASTPVRLKALSRRLGEPKLAVRPSPDEWSATEILNHLRANADAWGANIQRMIDEDHPIIRYVSPRSVMKKPEYAERGFKEAFKLFVDNRNELVDTLRSLSPEGWSRGATFTGTTRGREATVMSYAQRIAVHEAEHIAQFEALLT